MNNVKNTEIPKYLTWNNPDMDLRYTYDDYTGEYEVTQIFTKEREEQLQEQNIDLKQLKATLISDVIDRQNETYGNRFIMGLVIFLLILIPAFALFLIQGNMLALVVGIVYATFAFFLVESYNQANLNYYQARLYEKLKNDQIITF